VAPILERVLEELMVQTDVTIELLVPELVEDFDERTKPFIQNRKQPSWASESTMPQQHAWLRAQLW
jgi:hypothetical protein